MKVLLFSHGSDIDGMGSIIISKLFFNTDYHYSEIHNLDEQILEEIKSKNIYKYDYIFITDLTPKNETLDIIEKDKELINKLVVIDHHQTNYNRANNYSFVNITINNDKGQACATSLFYEYLVNSKLIKENKVIEYYTELTRLEDTWEWTIKNNNLAHNLSHLFNILGRDKYVELMINKLKEKEFSINSTEQLLIDSKINDINKHIQEYLKYKKDIILNNHKGILVIIDYEYRNDLPEYLNNNDYDYEFAMMVCFNHNSISFRSITNCNVREIAEQFGGGGHNKASSCYINDKLDKIYDILLTK